MNVARARRRVTTGRKQRTVLPVGSWMCVVAVVLIPLMVGMPVAAQSNESADGETVDPDEPLPYDPTEFPAWARDLRRGEIIALGAFPVAMIVSGLGYQLGRFTYRSIEAGSVQPEYAPGFLSPEGGARYTEGERVGLIISSVAISVGIAVADYLLGRRERRDRGDSSSMSVIPPADDPSRR